MDLRIINVEPLKVSFTTREFYINQAAVYKFEYDEDQLLELALAEDFIYPDVNNKICYKLRHRSSE